MVNNSYAKRKLQTILELCEESDEREQSSHSHRNPDWGSRNEVPRRWESVGDERADGDERGGGVGGVASGEESSTNSLNFRPLLNIEVVCPVRCVVIEG